MPRVLVENLRPGDVIDYAGDLVVGELWRYVALDGTPMIALATHTNGWPFLQVGTRVRRTKKGGN